MHNAGPESFLLLPEVAKPSPVESLRVNQALLWGWGLIWGEDINCPKTWTQLGVLGSIIVGYVLDACGAIRGSLQMTHVSAQMTITPT